MNLLRKLRPVVTTLRMSVALSRVALAPVALATLALAPLACMKAPSEGRAEQYSDSQVNFVDQGLSDKTAIGKIRLSYDESHLLHADVPVRPAVDEQLSVDWRVTFLDQNGIPLGPPNGWTAITLAPNVFRMCW